MQRIVWAVVVLLIVLASIYYRQVLKLGKEFFSFITDITKNSFLLWQLTKRDFQNRYLGTFFGLPWAFLQPSINLFVMWFVLAIGFRMGNAEGGVPYFPWLVSAMIPWQFMSECMMAGTNVLTEYSYLIKKVNMRVSIIPLIKIISAFFIHLFFIFFLILVALIYGIFQPLFIIQIIYYLIGAIYLSLGVVFLTSSINVFVKDMAQVLGVFIQLFFWITPIMWGLGMISPQYHFIFYANPFYYILVGYRNTFTYHKWFFTDIRYALYFWSVSTIIFVFGALVFRRLKPHFGDVL